MWSVPLPALPTSCDRRSLECDGGSSLLRILFRRRT